MKVLDASLKHKDQVCTLIHLKKGIIMDKYLMHIDSITLFLRLVVITERSDILSHSFKYELALFSTLLFKDSAIQRLTR